MGKAQTYIAELWREMNRARAERGAIRLDAHDREMFCIGMRAAGLAVTMYGTTGEEITTVANEIERNR